MNGSKKAVAVGAAIVLLGLIAGAVTLYANQSDKSDLSRFATGDLATLVVPPEPTPAPDHAFKTSSGADTTLADFRGKVVVVNVWAMWCAPCRTEMPTLATLAQAYQGTDLLVLPVNVDATPDQIAAGAAFIDDHAPLPFYSDPTFQLPFELPGKGAMPQTILLDRKGKVRASYSGGAHWAGPEARALIDALLAEPG